MQLLSPTNTLLVDEQGLDGKRSWHNILEAAGKTRPTLLETVYGLDVIIPGEAYHFDYAQQVSAQPCLVVQLSSGGSNPLRLMHSAGAAASSALAIVLVQPS